MSGVCLTCGEVTSCDSCVPMRAAMRYEKTAKAARLAAIREVDEWVGRELTIAGHIPVERLLAKLKEMMES